MFDNGCDSSMVMCLHIIAFKDSSLEGIRIVKSSAMTQYRSLQDFSHQA